MAKHVSYLFIRDALILYESKVEQDPDKDTNHLDVSSAAVEYSHKVGMGGFWEDCSMLLA